MAFNKKLVSGIIRSSILGLFLTFSLGINANAMTIVLDPGHGGFGTTGAGALYPPYMEKSLNLSVASQLKSELEGAGIKTYMTRTSDAEAPSLEARASYAKSVNADLLISIHMNSSGAHDKSGSEVWTSLYGSYYSTGASLGRNILSQLSGLGLANKGVKTKLGNSGDYYGILRYGAAQGIPTIIVEHCFMDNPYDRSILDSKGPGGLAHADAAGIINFVNSVGGAGASLPKSDPVVLAEGATAMGSTAGAAVNPTVKANTGAAGAAGAAAASTTVSFPKDAAGNIIYTDPSGGRETFTPAQWNKLLGLWAYTGQPEYYIRQQRASDLRQMAGN